MRLDELTGVKKHHTRTLWDVLDDFKKAGGETFSGQNGTVLTHPKWAYVFKFFENDEYYLRYVRWAMRQNSPHVPVFLSKPRRITPFYMRSDRTPQIYVVKMERLTPITDPWLKQNFDWLVNGPTEGMKTLACRDQWEEIQARYADLTQRAEAFQGVRGLEAVMARSDIRDEIQSMMGRVRFIQAFQNHPGLDALMEFIWTVFASAKLDGAHDLHAGNIMQREDGTYVLTDPLWKGGTSPLEQHRRMMQAEVLIDDPDYDRFDDEHGPQEPKGMLKGGQRWPKRQRPKKAKPQTVKHFSTDNDDEIPF